MSATKLKQDLIQYARSLGFERVGITSAEPLKKEAAFLETWLAEGRAGEMDYLEREPSRRSSPTALLPEAKSVIALAMNYAYPSPALRAPSPRGRGHTAAGSPLRTGDGRRPEEGYISRYAWGRDYHKVLNKRLEALVRYLEALSPGCQCRSYVDTGPLLERAFAQRAGLGFIGKNTMLITKGLGSWVFLASVVTTIELPHDAPDERSCGECRLCIDACPTEAITAPFQLDARRCISYLTIESEASVPLDLRPKMGGWIYGCDICQEVCPHNVRPGIDAPVEFKPGGHHQVGLAEILALADDAAFQKLFAGTPLTRAGREGLVRNACVAAANLGRRDLIPQLETISRHDPHDVVREQAAWALERLLGGDALLPPGAATS